MVPLLAVAVVALNSPLVLGQIPGSCSFRTPTGQSVS